MNFTPFLTHDFQRVLEVVDYTNPDLSLIRVNCTIKYITDYQPADAEKGATPVIFLSNLKTALEKVCSEPTGQQKQRGYLTYVKEDRQINLEPIRDLIRHYTAYSKDGLRIEVNGVDQIRTLLRAASEMVLDYLTPANVEEYKAAAETLYSWSFFFNEISD